MIPMFSDLEIGAHYRLYSTINDAVILPSVRVKVSETQYKMLHPANAVRRLAAKAVKVAPVTAAEKADEGKE